MSRATIKIEFTAGDTIKESFEEAIRISRILKCNIDFKFNDVYCMAHPNGIAEEGVKSYHSAITSKSKYKFANC